MRPFILSVALACALAISACASDAGRPRLAPVGLTLALAASSDVNPDDKGRAAPIVVRLYELKDAATFNDADFFTLQDKDKTVLADDLLVRDQFQLRPGESMTITREANQATTTLGVLAAYRDLPNAVWRATWRLPSRPEAAWYRRSPRLGLTIRLDRAAIVIADEQSKAQAADR
ncbi:type VI secretion system lipoprotein TssJ [Caballeronia ptereochthonis]|uniref:Lipoprotein n=1 Tax=Caballeronia ptereochthonis TaxID=1777144 RepID=A0A158A982_9BURK|nr:type VI secretion system lipoprotein TssJ [Caballeronia ptereochthonis]SAK54156.1 lipoprotein [Caballeronia ptereochthonis]